MQKEEDFNNILTQYMPMVFGAVKRWNLYRDQDEYEQIGRIALYEAWLRFNEETGCFAPYAKSYVYGRIRHELTRRDKIQTNSFSLEPEILANEIQTVDGKVETHIMLRDIIERAGLTPREKDWTVSYVFDNMKPAAISKKYGVSVTTVKSWRKAALKKLQQLQPFFQ